MLSSQHFTSLVGRMLFRILPFWVCVVLSAQQPDSSLQNDSRLRVFVDCKDCDVSYFSRNFEMVQFATDPGVSDVIVSINEMDIGMEHTWTRMVFRGKKRFLLLCDTLEFLQASERSPEDYRAKLLDKIKLGLVPYLLKTPDGNRLFVLIDPEAILETVEKDPWDFWAFSLSAIGSYYKQENYRSLTGNFCLYVSRITEKFKFESQNFLNLTETTIEIYDPFDSVTLKYKTFQRGWSSNTLAVKSLGTHAGFGGLLQIRNDHLNNLDLRVRAGPAVEFNIFPYSEALTRQIRFLYSCQYEYARYVIPSIYNSMRDENWRHQLSIIAGLEESWGSVTTSLTGASYVKHPSKYSLHAGLMTMIYVPFTKGLSLNMMGGMSMYRDRINQAGTVTTPEDLLIYQQAMEQDFRIQLSFGITYRFGSRAFPALNARFSQ